jgi:vacuolar-type H+-ATPase subunit F/Vma7
MVTPTRRLGVAVIGDEDLVSGMRLAGVRRCHVVNDEHQGASDIREALQALLAEPDIAIIVIPEEYEPVVEEELAKLRESRRLVPVVLPVPSRRGTRFGDARTYYRQYIRKFIGFDIEV